MAMYRKYQNVKPPARRGWYQRSAMLATLLLLLACTVSAGAVYVIYPEIFTPASASGLSEADVKATVEGAVLTANAEAGGTAMSTEEFQTAIAAAVLQTMEASWTPDTPLALATETPGSPIPTLPGSTGLPQATPTPTRTLRPGETPPTSAPTPTPSRTPTETPTQPGVPSSTSAPSATVTSAPPTPEPTATKEWKSTCGPDIPQGHCNQTQTAEAAPPTSTPPTP